MNTPVEPQCCDAFLSHGSPDKPWVRALYQHLTAAGVIAYLDEVAIEAGDNFVCNLNNGIGRTNTFVIVVSQGTMARPWVEHEWTSFLATHGPRNRIIPVLLDEVQLPPFLRPYQVIHTIDRDASAVAARIVRALGKGKDLTPAERYTGQALIFTLASIESSEDLAVIPADGVRRTVTPPWRRGHAFGIALRDFEKMTREALLDDAARTRLTTAAQTVGAGLLELLVSDDALRATFDRATAAGPRAVFTVQSEEDFLLALPWELLYRDGHFLVRDGMLDVVRSTTGAVQFETQLTPPNKAFTLVTNVSAPEGSGLSHEAESYRITHALTEQCPETPTELGTLEDLLATVARERPRGIHFSGHGTPGALIFENDEGFEDRVEIDQLVTKLRQLGDGALPPFFYLACCHGNTPPQPAKGQAGSASSAAQLHRAGVTEVVGYYGPIADGLSTRAEEALYGAIAAGELTRLAIGKARVALLRAFADEPMHRPALARGAGIGANVAYPFAWAQLVLYRRGPEHPLSTPASREKLRRHEASLTRTYRYVLDRAFLETGFIGRRQELHQLRRRRKRGDRVFVLQGLGGLGKTTLAGQLLPMLADEAHMVILWCRRTEGEQDQAEALVGQLLVYARARFGSGFEQVVSHVDRQAGEDSVQRFVAFLQVILAEEQGTPLVVYLDNLESLLHGPDCISLTAAPDPEAFGDWRSEDLRDLWRMLVRLSGAVEHLYVVASCRYRNDDLAAGLLPVSPLVDADLFRLMAWYPALRRLSAGTRARLVGKLAGHPRGVEFMDDLVAAEIRKWEETQGEWSAPVPGDVSGMEHEWERLIDPILPRVKDRIWSDLLLAVIWEQVLDERARRMLFRMTLLRRPWEDGLIAHLGEPEEPDMACRTAEALAGTSLLEQIDRTVRTQQGLLRRRHYTVHATTAAFVQSRFLAAGDLACTSHHRIGTYLEKEAKTSPDLTIDLEAGHHLFEAHQYDRAYELLGAASDWLQDHGMVREGLQILLPFLPESVQRGMSRERVGQLLGTIGNAYVAIGEPRRAIEYHKQQLIVVREIGDRRGEGNAIGNLGIAHQNLGELDRALKCYEQHLVIAREIGDRRGEGNALGNLGLVYADFGEPRRAIEYYEQQLVVVREIGDRRGEGNALGNLGNAYAAFGDARRAIEYYEQRLVIAREIGDRRGEGNAIGNLGIAHKNLGELDRALKCYEQHLVIAREIGNRSGESSALGNLGTVYAALGEPHRAIECHKQALVIAREIGDRRGEGNPLVNLGFAYAALGEPHRAIEYHKQALIIAREIRDRRGEGNAIGNLGTAYAAIGEAHRAIEYYQQALAIGQEIEDPQIIARCESGLRRCRGEGG